MQSNSLSLLKGIIFKRYDEYEIGEIVWEGEFVAGKLLAKMTHPTRLMGYLLVVNAAKEYTILSCHQNTKSGVCLVRHLPEVVAKYFASEMLANKVTVQEKELKRPTKETNDQKPDTEKIHQSEKQEIKDDIVRVPVVFKDKEKPKQEEKHIVVENNSSLFDFI